MLKIIRINLFVLLGLLVFIEVSGQLFSLVRNKQLLFVNPEVKMRSELFRPHPYLSVALQKNAKVNSKKDNQYKSVTTTEIGTRWTGADLSDETRIRVACLGGSTTFCTGVNDDESWPALLQKKLGDKYAVVNYGVPAYKTSEAVIQMALYVPEIKPEIVIFYQGVNDFYNYYMNPVLPDYLYHAENVMPMALLGKNINETCFEKFKKQSGFFYIVQNIHERFQDPPEVKRFSEPDLLVDQLYARNLKTMFALAESVKAKPFLISQVLNPYYEREETPWSIRVKKESILPLMSRMNRIGGEVCNANNNCDFLDFENSIPWKPEHFWDDMHFTKEGNDLFATKLAEQIKSLQ